MSPSTASSESKNRSARSRNGSLAAIVTTVIAAKAGRLLARPEAALSAVEGPADSMAYYGPRMDFDRLMQEALNEARWARDTFEVPIGAVVAVDGEIIGRGFNHPINGLDPSAHAEIAAMRQAAIRLGNYRLTGATLCVTIEPCLMCVGAMVHARIGTLVYGAAEPKSGAIISTIRAAELPGLNHRFEIVSGIREEECRGLMVEFFRERR
jgi:tRNA(adenine34) deaminase